jgi:hypothetical protein
MPPLKRHDKRVRSTLDTNRLNKLHHGVNHSPSDQAPSS